MKYLSKVASMVCIAGVAVTLVGCGGSSTPPPADGEGPCAIPDIVKQDILLDQQTARAVTRMAVESPLIGLDIMQRVANAEDKKVKALSLDTKSLNPVSATAVKALNNVKPLREVWIDSDVAMGDDLACDEGTYSLHYSVKDELTDEDDVEQYQFKLNLLADFDNCVLYENGEKIDELMPVFGTILRGTSIIMNLRARSDDNITLSLNGSTKMDIEWLWSEYFLDNENSWEGIFTEKEKVSIANTNLSFDVDSIEEGKIFAYRSNGMMDVKWDWAVDFNGTRVEAEEGNTTTRQAQWDESIDVVMDIKESMQKGSGDRYSKTELKAYCYSDDIDAKGVGDYFKYEDNEDDADDITRDKWISNGNALSDGYGSFTETRARDGEVDQRFFDLYQDKLNTKVNFTNLYVDEQDTHIKDRNQTINITGRVGSTAVGGSADFITVDDWKTSNHFAENRNGIGSTNIQYIRYSPYSGQSIITSINQALVGFDVGDDNKTYGYIQVDNQMPVEYDNIDDMLNIW